MNKTLRGGLLSSGIEGQRVLSSLPECDLTLMATCMGPLSAVIPRTCPSQTSPNAPWPRALKNQHSRCNHQHRVASHYVLVLMLMIQRAQLSYLRSVMFLRGTSFSSLSDAAFPAKQQLGLQSVMMVDERILLSLYSGLCRRPLTACKSFFLRYHTVDKDVTDVQSGQSSSQRYIEKQPITTTQRWHIRVRVTIHRNSN